MPFDVLELPDLTSDRDDIDSVPNVSDLDRFEELKRK